MPLAITPNDLARPPAALHGPILKLVVYKVFQYKFLHLRCATFATQVITPSDLASVATITTACTGNPTPSHLEIHVLLWLHHPFNLRRSIPAM